MNLFPRESTAFYKPIGTYRHYEFCRFCESDNLETVGSMGQIPLAGGFLKHKKDFLQEKYYPLDIAFCKNCYLLQSVNVIHADTLFKDYFYHSSSIKTLVNYFETTAQQVSNMLKDKHDSLVVEIGCNDGSFIKALQQKKIKSIGVDPASNIVLPLIKKGYPIMNDYFSDRIAKQITRKQGKADIIVSFNTLAHVENMHTIIKGVKHLLKKDGILMFQVHYLGNVLRDMQYDMIYHEHQYYYSTLALQNLFSSYDMGIYDTEFGDIHAGSVMFYVQNKNSRQKNPISSQVKQAILNEKRNKFDKVLTYKKYFKKIKRTRRDIISLLQKLKSENKTIAGYGASGRATVLMNYCSIGNNFLDYVIDDAPAKQGAYTPGTHLRIVSSGILKTRKRPDYVLLFAWSFYEEIIKKNKEYITQGGSFIIPLPEVTIKT